MFGLLLSLLFFVVDFSDSIFASQELQVYWKDGPDYIGHPGPLVIINESSRDIFATPTDIYHQSGQGTKKTKMTGKNIYKTATNAFYELDEGHVYGLSIDKPRKSKKIMYAIYDMFTEPEGLKGIKDFLSSKLTLSASRNNLYRVVLIRDKGGDTTPLNQYSERFLPRAMGMLLWNIRPLHSPENIVVSHDSNNWKFAIWTADQARGTHMESGWPLMVLNTADISARVTPIVRNLQSSSDASEQTRTLDHGNNIIYPRINNAVYYELDVQGTDSMKCGVYDFTTDQEDPVHRNGDTFATFTAGSCTKPFRLIVLG